MSGKRKTSPDRASSPNETVRYDNLGRLTEVARNSSAYQNFTMSNTGAITAIKTSGSTVSRGTNDENQVTSVGGNDVSYDDNGNVTVDDAGRRHRIQKTDTSTTVLQWLWQGDPGIPAAWRLGEFFYVRFIVGSLQLRSRRQKARLTGVAYRIRDVWNNLGSARSG